MRKHPVMGATLMLCIGLLAGCSTPAAITLKDGRELQSLDTPEFDEDSGFYEFKQPDGKLTRLNKDEVRSIKDLD
ncbi:MAG TPA: YgdI/YgdR family lipoprotein [Pseudomonas sp.]